MPPSGPEAVRWLERAATHGYLEAQSTLAAMYIHGIPGLAAAQAGNDLGARPAAALFSANEPAKPDFERALEWARRAAEGGSADGQALYAYVLTNGPEGTRDLERAEELYRRSAAADCPQGCLGLALALLRNNHDADQHQQAATLLKRAAEAGPADRRIRARRAATSRARAALRRIWSWLPPVTGRRRRRACDRRRRATAWP